MVDGVVQIRVYNKLLEQQTNSTNPTTCGVKSWVRSELMCVKIYPSRLCEAATGGKMMILSVVLSIGLQLDDTLKYQPGAHGQRTT